MDTPSTPDSHDAFILGKCNNAVLRRAARKLGQFYDDALAPSGLRATQQGLLYLVSRLGEPTMSQLATELVMDLSALGHTMKPLERDGLVELFQDSGDRRVRRVRLTAGGRAKTDEAMRLWQKAQDTLEEKLGADRAETLRRALDDLSRIDLRSVEP